MIGGWRNNVVVGEIGTYDLHTQYNYRWGLKICCEDYSIRESITWNILGQVLWQPRTGSFIGLRLQAFYVQCYTGHGLAGTCSAKLLAEINLRAKLR